jgi:hypothetical protein
MSIQIYFIGETKGSNDTDSVRHEIFIRTEAVGTLRASLTAHFTSGTIAAEAHQPLIVELPLQTVKGLLQTRQNYQ